MATNKDVNIKITTKADARALKRLNSEMTKLAKTTAKTSGVTKKALTDEEKTAKKLAATNKKIADDKKKADDKAKLALVKLQKEKHKAEIAAHKHNDALKAEIVTQRKLTNTTSQATAATGKAKKANIDLGRSTLLASQGYEDLQFGIGGVLNNIPPLVMALGGTAGLAGVISIAAVAASQMGNVFDTTKKETDDLTAALDTLANDVLPDYGKEVNKATSDDFAKSQHRIKLETEGVNDELKEQIDFLQKLSDIRIKEEETRIKLEIQKVSQSKLGPVEKVTRTAELEKGLASFKNQAASKALEDQLSSLVTILSTAEKDLQRLFKEQDVIRDSRVSDDSIRGARKRSVLANKVSKKEIKGLGEFQEEPGFLEGIARGQLRDEFATVNTLAADYRKRVKEFNDAIKSEASLGDDSDLGAMVDLMKQFKSDTAKLVKADKENKLSSVDQVAQDQIAENMTSLDESIRALDVSFKTNQRLAILEAKKKELAERSGLVESRISESQGIAGGARRAITVAEQERASLLRRQSMIREEESLKAQKDYNSATKRVADSRKKEADARAKSEAATLSTAQKGLISSGKDIGTAASGISVGTASGQAVIDIIAAGFKDGVISATEGPSMKKAIANLNQSNIANNNAVLNALKSMIAENAAMAKQVEALKTNARRQEK